MKFAAAITLSANVQGWATPSLTAMMGFLARWTRHLSWRQTALVLPDQLGGCLPFVGVVHAVGLGAAEVGGRSVHRREGNPRGGASEPKPPCAGV